jgi:hypothetical protein
MNKDKRVAVAILADLCGAYNQQRSVPSKVLMILRDSVKELADSEQRSLKKMEPFKDNEGTAQNYRNSTEVWEDLTAAKDALEEGEVEEALPLLQRVARPDDTAKPAEPYKAPVKTRRRSK